MNNSMKFPTFDFRISHETYDRKPTGEEVASEIKKQKATEVLGECIKTKKLDDLCNYIEAGRMIFPNKYAVDTSFVCISLLFFDFDNTGGMYYSRNQVITKLKKINLCPNIIYDTYNNGERHNRFRIVYLLGQPSYSEDELKRLENVLKKLLSPYGVDQKANMRGVFFGGSNAQVLRNESYNLHYLLALEKKIEKAIEKNEKYKGENLMLPTAKGFAWALNLVDDSLHRKIKNRSNVVLRILKENTDAVNLDFDNNIADVNLSLLKILYTMHCRNQINCVNREAETYSITLAEIVKKTGLNLYEREMKRLKQMLQDYSRLVAITSAGELFWGFKGTLDGKTITYSGKYFNWLKKNLFEKPEDTVPMEHTHNYLMRYSAFVGGNMYAELLAEQFIQSVLWSGNIDKYFGITAESLINRSPQVKCKYNSIDTTNKKNTFITRVFEGMSFILSQKSSFLEKYDGYHIKRPDFSSKHLDRKITIDADEKVAINNFLDDFEKTANCINETTENATTKDAVRNFLREQQEIVQETSFQEQWAEYAEDYNNLGTEHFNLNDYGHFDDDDI